MNLLKGITVTLYTKTVSGSDAFGAPTYTTTPVSVSNVIVEPIDASAITDQRTLEGGHEAYRLHIPKGDTHNWNNAKVVFFGKAFKQYGTVLEYIEELLPLEWNKKITVERYE